MKMRLMRSLMRTLRSPRTGSMMSLRPSPIPMLPSLRNGTMRKMVTGLLPLSPTPSALRLPAVVNGSGEFVSDMGASSFLNAFYSPLKANPDYKGKWFAPMIDNPDYKGPWAPRKIPNPDFFEDLTPVKSLPKIVCRFPCFLLANLTH